MTPAEQRYMLYDPILVIWPRIMVYQAIVKSPAVFHDN